MTTAAQIHKLAQPLLNRNSDLTIIGRFVFFKQVGHLLRGIYVDRYSNKEGFTPVWLVDCLFRPTKEKSLGIGLGEQIYPTPAGYWYINNPNMDDKFADSMEEVALPKLNSLKTIEQFSNISYNLSSFHKMNLEHSPLRKFYVDLAIGKFEEADRALDFFLTQPDYRAKYFHSPEHYDEVMNIIRPMILDQDKTAIATKLHEWEAYSVKQLKLEKYWQPSPFPIEL